MIGEDDVETIGGDGMDTLEPATQALSICVLAG